MAKLGGTAELFGPFFRERMALFDFMKAPIMPQKLGQ